MAGALAVGDFSFGKKSDAQSTPIPINPSTYRGNSMGNGWSFSTAGGVYSYFQYNSLHSCTDAYIRCPGLNAVINKKAQAFINGKTWILDSATNSESKGIYGTQLRKLLANPNPFQTWSEFEAQAYIYIQTYGFCPVLAIKPEGYTKNIDASMLWNIPPTMIDPHYTGKLLKQKNIEDIIDYVAITFKGEYSKVSIKDLCILKDVTVSTTISLFPDSRIVSLEMPINNQIGAYESRNVLINFRGALGIFSRDAATSGQIPIPAITETEKKELQADFRRYGLRDHQWQFIITTAALKWTPVSVPTKDLMLFEEVKDSNEAICDKFGYPFELMANAKGTTFENRRDAGKDLYQNTTIPEAGSFYGQLNTFFDTPTYGLIIDKDYSKVPILQEDENVRMTARKTRNEAYKIEWDNDLITLNQWREANGEDALPDGNLRKSELLAKTKQPLVNIIGVGGVQAAISLVTTPGMPAPTMQAFFEIMFGISAADASRLSANPLPAPTINNQTESNAG